jgi:uracil-DNA glycosylase
MSVPEPVAPRSLADPAQLAARRRLVGSPHVLPLRHLVAQIAADTGASVPDPDPLDGGVMARLLLLLETPGPAIRGTGIVSRDNPTGTAANLFRFLQAARIPRAETLIWNAVPWVIHAEGARNRAPRRSEIRAAVPYFAPLLDCLPVLRVVVLAGRVAGELESAFATLRTGLPVLRIPHPSPTFVCTAPSVRERIAAGLSQASAILATTRVQDGDVGDRDAASLAIGPQTP